MIRIRSGPENRASLLQVLKIRIETLADHEMVTRIHEQAFGGTAEARLVEEIRDGAVLSLVAEERGLVGHVLFSPLVLRREGETRAGVVSLAPLAVLPGHQRAGVGTALVHEAHERLVASGTAASVVLGDPAYYARFGYRPAAPMGLSGPYDEAGDAFMALELVTGALSGGPWIVEYPPAFDGV